MELPARLLADAFDRVHDDLHAVLGDIDAEALTWRPGPDANSIAWLTWHLTRVQDDHISGVAGRLDVAGGQQVWLTDGWYERFNLPFDRMAHGYGQSSSDVAQVAVSAELLLGYHDAVHAHCHRVLGHLRSQHYDQIVDTRWTPHVSAGVRLISIVNDTTQHVGQVAYLRGLWDNRGH